jgi:hypothetical protein
MSEINPFYSLSRVISQKYRDGARANRDTAAFHNMQAAMAMHHVQNQATIKQTAQQARITEKSEQNRSNRATEFFGTVHSHAEPGKPVSIKHGEISANYTPATPKSPAAPQPGRVPVKKVRGGKKNS